MDVILQTTDLTKRYGRGKTRVVTALKSVTLTIEKGRIYGLIGNNGSGKTTFMRLITGLSKPTSGTISLFGSASSAELAQARGHLGALVESPACYPDLTVMQNLKAQAMLGGETIRQSPAELCRLVGIDPRDVGRRRLKHCLLGQCQRYGIASALFGNPEFLLLDEPLNGLDPSGVSELRELLLRLNQDLGITMIVSSHVLSELHKVATDYIFFDMGEVVETISAQKLEARLEERGIKDVEAYFIQLTRRNLTW